MPQPVITVRNLRKTYGKLVAVGDVSFDVHAGEIFGLIGPNGAGKTTTMEMVEGHRKPDGGTISVLGMNPVTEGRALQRRIGVQHQAAQLQKRIKVWEAVDLWSRLYDRVVDTEALLEQLGLTAKRNAWFMTLSGGQKQRLFIALALIHDPEIVFLDELTTGLDPQARHAIWGLIAGIKDRGKTVFLTTHLMEEAERLCDRVAIIEHGKVIEMDTPAELIRRHCPQRTVLFSSRSPGLAEQLKDLGEGVSAFEEEGSWKVSGKGDSFVTRVIRAVASRNIEVADFRTISPTLEDVFLKLTGHTIRD